MVSFQALAASQDKNEKIEKVKVSSSIRSGTSGLVSGAKIVATGVTTTDILDPTESVSDLNDFIVDLYKPKIDKLLEDFQSATYKATKGNVRSEVATYVRLGETVEKRIDALEDQKLTPNRKAILKGVLEYLYARIGRIIEGKKEEITNSFDS